METVCPYCDYIATEHETLDQEKSPKDGDFGFCIECGKTATFLDGELVKVDINKMSVENQKEMRRIEEAWVKTRYIATKLNSPKTNKTNSEVEE